MFKVSDYVTSVKITLAKASPLAKPSVTGIGTYTPPPVVGPAYMAKSMKMYTSNTRGVWKVEDSAYPSHPSAWHIIYFNLNNNTMESVSLIFLFYRWGNWDTEGIVRIQISYSQQVVVMGFEPSKCDVKDCTLTTMIHLLPNMPYGQYLRESEPLCLERRSHVFTILLTL